MLELAVSPAINAQLKLSSRRRSIGIKVVRGKVIVSAPSQLPMKQIQQFVKQKAAWVQGHLQKQQCELAKFQERQYRLGDTVSYLGKTLVLSNEQQSDCNLSLPESAFKLELAKRKVLIEGWYINKALSYIQEQVAHYSRVMKVFPQGIKIRYYKSRWGSCNSRGQLQFNWTLMMAPAAVVDYVIVHELAHLQHFNHSPQFWRLVETIVPNHKEHRAWLKNQTELNW